MAAKTGFYGLSKPQRTLVVQKIGQAVLSDLAEHRTGNLERYGSDEDTYIRKTVYTAVGKIYGSDIKLRQDIWRAIDTLINHPDPKIRQTMVYAVGEIGKTEDTEKALAYFDGSLKDGHHSVRNAVIGSLKMIGQKKS